MVPVFENKIKKTGFFFNKKTNSYFGECLMHDNNKKEASLRLATGLEIIVTL